MSVVYEAVHQTTERHIAIKFLHEEFYEDREPLGRFFNEAIASNALAHPGMVQVFDSGMLDGETPYLIMEYLRGPRWSSVSPRAIVDRACRCARRSTSPGRPPQFSLSWKAMGSSIAT